MKVIISHYRTLLVFTFATLLFACAGVSPKANLYKLNVNKDVQQSENITLNKSATSAIRVQIMPISIDETVDRPQIVMTNTKHEVQYLEQQRWAQPLKYEIGRVIGEDLSAQLAIGMVSAYPHQLNDPDVQVSLQVLTFESSYTAPTKLKVNLTVHNLRNSQSSSQTLEFTQLTSSEKSQVSIDDIINAHSQNISRLSQAILAAIIAM